MSAQNLRKLLVNLGSSTLFGKSSTKIILKSIIFKEGNGLMKGALKMACAQKLAIVESMINELSKLYKLSKF